MPNKAYHFCNWPGCDELTTERYCPEHQKQAEAKEKEAKAKTDRYRGSSAQRGYDGRWRKARITFLKHHPLCAECERQGKLTPATVVDHIIPHKGDSKLFWDRNNWQPLCAHHHSIKTNKEDGGYGNTMRTRG